MCRRFVTEYSAQPPEYCAHSVRRAVSPVARLIRAEKAVGSGEGLNYVFITYYLIQVKNVDPLGSWPLASDLRQSEGRAARWFLNSFIRLFMRQRA